jgi:heme-degrading monooxygenase HmoA
VFSSTFIFAKKQYDDEFHALDAVIADVAKNTPGYLGEENWENNSTGQVSNVYYWDSLEALQQLMKHPSHLEAKQKQANWLNGYRVEISEVIRTYGDSLLPNVLSNAQSAEPL